MGSITAPTFNGTSPYAQDFQAAIDRAVSIASLPLQQLYAQKTTLTDESSALTGLDTKFSALQTAIQALQSATGVDSFAATASDPAIVSLTTGEGVMEGTYTLEVTGLGAYTSTLSSDSLTRVTNPASQSLSTSASFTLTVNGTDYTVTPAANTLTALAQAINDLEGADVHASIVNVGSSASPDYRLSVQGAKLASGTIQLNDGSGNLLDTLVVGAPATYKVNGLASEIQSDSRTVTLSPGLTVQLLAQSDPGDAVTISVSRSASSVSSALSSFVNAYNAAVDELGQQRGETAGPLAGSSILNALYDSLRGISLYSGGSGVADSLSALGVQLDQYGKFSFDSAAFDTLAGQNIDAVMSFIGSATASGFLKAATDVLNSVEDTFSGSIKIAIKSTTEQITAQDKQIAESQDRINELQQNLTEQMSAADALVASLQNQLDYMKTLFESMRIASEMYK